MDLVVEELQTELSQDMTALRDTHISAIRPHLYRHNTPTGSLTIEVRDQNDGVIASSNTISIASLLITGGSGLAFVHAYFKFDVDASLLKDQKFRIALVPSGGYSFSEAAYVGWCKDFDLRRYDADFIPNIGLSSALDLEIWSIRDRGRVA